MTPSEQERHDRFLHLFIQHEEALRAFVRALVHDREAAREVLQEVAAVLWRKFDELESEDKFRRWAFGVARFEALAALRDRARDRHTFSEELLLQMADETAELDDALEDEREALARCLRRLPDSKRALIAAAYEPGARIDQLAARMGRTAMAIYKTLHRIRMALVECTRRELNREGLP
jgi:RNA polymerase sigma-70 factor (ECF subfamily)